MRSGAKWVKGSGMVKERGMGQESRQGHGIDMSLGWAVPWEGARAYGDMGLGGYKNLGKCKSLDWAGVWEGARAWVWEGTGAQEGTAR